MKILIINLSPRQQGTSSMFTEYFAEAFSKEHEVETASLYKQLAKTENLLVQVKNADTIVMVGPCYVDSFPAETIHLLEQMSQEPEVLHGQNLYGLIQGGMPYVHTHKSGLFLLQNFAADNQMIWKGGFAMGGGAALNGQSIEHVLGAKKMVPAIHQFMDAIMKSEECQPELYRNAQMKIPSAVAFILSKALGHMIRKKYRNAGVDYKQISPYLLNE